MVSAFRRSFSLLVLIPNPPFLIHSPFIPAY
jgi:hypothetical protein